MVTTITRNNAEVKRDGYRLITSLKDLSRMVEAFRLRKEPVAFDTENTGLNPRSIKPIMLQFKQGDRPTNIVDARRLYEYDDGEFREDETWAGWVSLTLAPLFDGTLLVLGANLKYDYQVMRCQFGIKMRRVFDVMVAEQVILGLGMSDARTRGIGLSLKAIAERRNAGSMSKEERNWFVDLDQRVEEWNAPFPTEQLEYAALDVAVLKPIYEQQLQEFKDCKLISVGKLEMRVLPALAEVEVDGVLIDSVRWMEAIDEKEKEARGLEEEVLGVFAPAILEARSKKFDEALELYRAWENYKAYFLEATKQAYEIRDNKDAKWGDWKRAGMKLFSEANPNPGKPKPDNSIPNLNSTNQLLDAFSVLGIPVKSTGSDVLETIKDDYDAIDLLMRYRKAIKFVQTYGKSLIEKIDPVTGMIHPNYHQIGASTGRMSCTSPNWQNIPAKEDGKKLRACVIAPKGFKLLVCDFASQELLILANESQDASMLTAFRNGVDLHSATARLMFNLSEGVDTKKCEVSPGLSARSAAKAINYGIVYGQGAKLLANNLKIAQPLAKELMSKWFLAYPQVTTYLEGQKHKAISEMKSTCLDGRVRLFSLQSEPARPTYGGTKDNWEKYQESVQEYRMMKARIERQGANSPIQGGGAGMTKLAVALFYEEANKVKDKELACMIAVVHDECIVRCKEEDAEYWREKLAWAMDTASRHYCPIVSTPVMKNDVIVSDYWSKE